MSTLPPPEAVLIEEARKVIRPTVSVRLAAAKSNISEGRWRQIVKGYQTAKPDLDIPVRAPAATLARMADAVNVSAQQLKEAGRSDAALELNLLHQTADEGAALDLSHIPDQQLMEEVSRRLADRAGTPTETPGKRFPPIHAVARKVPAHDTSTYRHD